MKSSLSATHLLRVFALFALVVLFLLTLTRAGFSLWQLNRIESVDGFNQLQGLAELFILGWRFDLALIGAILFIPVTLGTLLAMLGPLRHVARFLILLFLVLGLAFILVAEYITPYFLFNQETRPDLPAIHGIENPVQAIAGLWSSQMIPAVIGLVLAILILIAFIVRLESTRLLRFRIAPLSGICLMLVGGALCLFAVISNIDFIQNPGTRPTALHPSASLISADPIVNELSLNTAYKMGWSLVPTTTFAE
jgi:phosphoglycerol transferase MdoB-like AlkP superfamily enzyme